MIRDGSCAFTAKSVWMSNLAPTLDAERTLLSPVLQHFQQASRELELRCTAGVNHHLAGLRKPGHRPHHSLIIIAMRFHRVGVISTRVSSAAFLCHFSAPVRLAGTLVGFGGLLSVRVCSPG